MPTNAKFAVREMLAGIVRSLVDRPDDVAIEVVEGENSSTLQIRSHPADVRKIVGENGRTAEAIRLLINATAVKRGCGRFNIEIANAATGSPSTAD